jgi:hypothetical protein
LQTGQGSPGPEQPVVKAICRTLMFASVDFTIEQRSNANPLV